MLGFRPLQVAKRKSQPYSHVAATDLEEGDYPAATHESGSDSDMSSPASSAYSSRAPSAASPSGRGAPKPHRRTPSRPSVSAYSYRNPRAFTRYFGFAIASTMLLFMWFLLDRSWDSIRSAELGLLKSPPPPPVWESFPFLKRYHGGIRALVSREANVPEYPRPADIDPDMGAADAGQHTPPSETRDGAHVADSVPFDPYPDYGSAAYVAQHGPVATCYLDANDTVRVPGLRAYKGVPDGMPDNVMGSYGLLGLRNDVCFERFGRLAPYGLGYSKRRGGTGAGMEGHRDGIESVWAQDAEVDFAAVRWNEAMERCLDKNKARFTTQPAPRGHAFQAMAPPKRRAGDANSTAAGARLPRTAVLIRTWWDYSYDDEDLMFLRALVAELGLGSGGEYQVHFLIHVKDDNKQIWADDAVYQQVLADALPAEFAGMGTLWSERQMALVYGGVEESNYRGLPVYGAYRSTFMPVTYFAHQHPEFDFFWHWEMDVRYTGHYYHLFAQLAQWADAQPRRGLWERNARFYVPAVHGSWDEFSHMVRVQTEHGTNSKANAWSSHLPPNPHVPERETAKVEKSVWGPEPPLDYPDIEIDDAAKPPHTLLEDKDMKTPWGVGEPADLIVLNPLFDPDHTNWILAEDVTGYNKTRGLPPRRTAINTSGRLSRRLLETMHREQSHFRHTMFSEMWPSSCALHHGLKAVYAPHPVFIDRKWPVQYLAAIFNNGRNGASGGARLSVFSDERQHNFLGTTWYYHAGFAPNLWKRWMGYKVDNDGGEEEELAGEGRMCLPAVLLHPVKQVDLIQERLEGP